VASEDTTMIEFETLVFLVAPVLFLLEGVLPPLVSWLLSKRKKKGKL
jgi:hypothetical protein